MNFQHEKPAGERQKAKIITSPSHHTVHNPQVTDPTRTLNASAVLLYYVEISLHHSSWVCVVIGGGEVVVEIAEEEEEEQTILLRLSLNLLQHISLPFLSSQDGL